jgi:hypothetical protein
LFAPGRTSPLLAHAEGRAVNAITTHLDDLIAVLRASADLRPTRDTAVGLRAQIAARLDQVRPELAARLRGLDDWHAEVLADFITDAHVVAGALEFPAPVGNTVFDSDTRPG